MPVGTPYGKYLLLERIASGGMGEVFLARARGGHRAVVVKRMLAEHTGDPEYQRLFLEEARLQARMVHPSLVQVLDLGRAEDGSLYLAMEYVHGRSLAETLARARQERERIPPQLAAQIAERAADALCYAHQLVDGDGRWLDIVHRDVSPHNLLLSFEGEVKLIDFGIAKSASSAAQTETGAIKGKFQYLSPEQSACAPLDQRSDLFSLGIVLYECLTGENPFVRSGLVAAIEAIQKVDPPPPSAVDPALAPFDAVVARALAKSPAQRHRDAGELRDELARLRGLVPPPQERLGEFLKRLFREGRPDEPERSGAAGAAGPGAATPREGVPAESAWNRPSAPVTAAARKPRRAEPSAPAPSELEALAKLESRLVRKRRAPVALGLALAVALAGLALAVGRSRARGPAGEMPPAERVAAPEAPPPSAAAAELALAVPGPPEAPSSAASGGDQARAEAIRSAAKGSGPSRPSRAVGREPARPAEPKVERIASPEPKAPTRPSLWVRPLPTGEVWLDGVPATSPLELARASGIVDLACEGSPLKIRLVVAEGGLELRSEPWAIVYVNGLSKGRTPARLPLEEATMRVELKRPGMDRAAQLILRRAEP